MAEYYDLINAMEMINHSKNEVSMKSQISRRKFIKKTILLCADIFKYKYNMQDAKF